ncbi:MAG: putative toxin-antitoxin system toxin component, PIN family [Moraxella sp.]|nr:putative toxin-antitoxin system toxin component, PIN family [Moraxella sp.]
MNLNKPKQAIVIDTNVLVSAILFSHSITAMAVRKALADFDVFVSHSTLNEFCEVVSRKKFAKYFIGREHERDEFIADFMGFVCVLENTTQQVTDCKDPKDNQFLEVALSCNAVYLVTGDKQDLLSMNPYKGVWIITVKEFLSM